MRVRHDELMKTSTLHVSDMKWEATDRFPGEATVKVLRRDDGTRKASTLLVRLDPGGRAMPHSHIAPVQHYVLEGEYECGGESCGPGTYRMFPAHADIPEITTRDGVTVLMIYDPVE